MERKKLTREDENTLIAAAQAGDESAHAELLRQFSPMLWKFARRRWSKWLTPEDLYQEAYLLFRRAIENFDTTAGAKLITYCHWTIPIKLSNMIDETRLIRVPRRQTLDTENALQKSANAREPMKQVNENMRTDDGKSVMADVIAREDAESLWRAFDELPERERQVLEMRMFGETLEVAGIQLGISKERVRQLETRAMRQLAEAIQGQTDEKCVNAAKCS